MSLPSPHILTVEPGVHPFGNLRVAFMLLEAMLVEIMSTRAVGLCQKAEKAASLGKSAHLFPYFVVFCASPGFH